MPNKKNEFYRPILAGGIKNAGFIGIDKINEELSFLTFKDIRQVDPKTLKKN